MRYLRLLSCDSGDVGNRRVLLNITGACFLSLTMFGASAADTVINFHGIITAGTCNITSGGNQTVQLGDISTSNFGNPGDVSSAEPFSVVLDCPEGGPDQATVTFSGAAASNPELLALDSGEGAATGVAVRINEINGDQIKLGTPSAVTTLAAGANTMTYQAQYQAMVDRPDIVAGVANATAQFTINYP